MIMLITGSLVGEAECSNVYADQQESTTSSDSSVPSISGVAKKVTRVENKLFDEKQYITYDIICCTFLLQLVLDGRDHKSTLAQYLSQSLVLSSAETNINDVVEELLARGGMEQLLMFLTGPVGAGKSTAIKLAQRFCFELCHYVGLQSSLRLLSSNRHER